LALWIGTKRVDYTSKEMISDFTKFIYKIFEKSKIIFKDLEKSLAA
jgi:hypothetical protein